MRFEFMKTIFIMMIVSLGMYFTLSYNPENNPDKLSFSLDRNQKHLMLLKLDKNTLRLLYCDTQVNVKENKKRLREYEKQNNNNPDAL